MPDHYHMTVQGIRMEDHELEELRQIVKQAHAKRTGTNPVVTVTKVKWMTKQARSPVRGHFGQ